MKRKQLVNIQIVPGADDPLYEQREAGLTHTSYREETALYTLVQQGNTAMLEQTLQEYLAGGVLVVGRLSKSALRQTKYWAVCCITLATRYAIQGGLDEMLAYNYSDQGIVKIDGMKQAEEIFAYLGDFLLELTGHVHKAAHGGCPPVVRRCLQYIDKHLHEKIALADLAALTGLTEDYISRLFKTHLGSPPSRYIAEKKLEAAKAMLQAGHGQREVAYTLGFCSQTYFITCFRRAYGVTPGQYLLRG